MAISTPVLSWPTAVPYVVAASRCERLLCRAPACTKRTADEAAVDGVTAAALAVASAICALLRRPRPRRSPASSWLHA